jgi:glycosyltransferase involved in cell wall biosynthesis
MAGPGIRAYAFARELSARFEVTLVAPNEIDLAPDAVATTCAEPQDARTLTSLARAHDAVVAQRLPVATALSLARSHTRVVYDLYDPVMLEALTLAGRRTRGTRDALQLAHDRQAQEVALKTGDAFVCASERQRDMWLGALDAAGRLSAAEYGRDPSLRELIDVVPFGLDEDFPDTSRPAMRGVLPSITEHSRILLWGGGIWNWFDPLTVIRAVHELGRERDDVRLVFMGMRRPNEQVVEATMASRAVALAEELGVRGRSVLFNEGWVPYEERAAWLAEADIGVSAHFDDVETRFAFRTRLLDYLWAGLPIVTTGGDTLGDLVDSESLGSALPVGDVSAWTAALARLLDDERTLADTRTRVGRVRARFVWRRVVEPLQRLLSAPGRPIDLARHARAATLHDAYLRGRISIDHRGPRGAAANALRKLAAHARTSDATTSDTA